MVSINQIVESLREKYKAEIHMGLVGEVSIDRLLFWQLETIEGEENTLYLAEYNEDFPESFNCPILFINAPDTEPGAKEIYLSRPTDLILLDVHNTIQNIINLQLSTNLKKEELFNTLYAGAGIRAMTQVAYNYLQNPVNICDTSFSLLYCMPEGEETDDIAEENGRQYIKSSSIESMRSEQLIDKLFHARAPFFSGRIDYEYEWLYCNIRIHNAVVGYICVQGSNRPFTDQDIDFIAIFAEMLSVEMQKSKFFIQNTGLRYEYFLDDLLSGRFISEETAHNRLKYLGREMDQYLGIITFFYEKGQKLHTTSGYFVEQMRSIFPKGMTIIYNNTPVILLSHNKELLFQSFQRQKLEDFLQFNHMNCAVSYSYTNILETPYFYKQALICEDLHHFSNSRIVHYEDIAVRHLLHLAESDMPLSSLIHPKIRQLMKYDHENNTDFCKTLRCYLENGRNASKTAAMLGIHKSTLAYRIDRIFEITNFELEDISQFFLFELSFWIRDYLEPDTTRP